MSAHYTEKRTLTNKGRHTYKPGTKSDFYVLEEELQHPQGHNEFRKHHIIVSQPTDSKQTRLQIDTYGKDELGNYVLQKGNSVYFETDELKQIVNSLQELAR